MVVVARGGVWPCMEGSEPRGGELDDASGAWGRGVLPLEVFPAPSVPPSDTSDSVPGRKFS